MARKAAKHRRYTDEFRASAVAAAIAAGYPSVEGALSKAARDLGIAHQLLRNWITAKDNPPPKELLQDKKLDLREMFLNEIYAAAGILPSKRPNASYSQLVIAMGTFFDKVRLIDNLPTEITASLSELMELAEFFREENIEMAPAIREWRQRLKAKKELRQSNSGEVANG